MSRSHYSYAHYADRDVAEGFDDLRFSGPIGSLVAESQRETLLAFAGDVAGADVLDVGTGTGRAARVLAEHGADVTGVDFSMEMLRVGAARVSTGGTVHWVRGDAHRLPFRDRQFDLTACFRLLMHVPDWRRCVQELCRVTRERVILDYPARASTAALQAVGRRVLAAAGRPTEAYRVFPDRLVAQQFDDEGFRVERVARLFVLPIALHKRINSRQWTERTEARLARLGLLRRFGSPVTVLAVRCAR